MDPHVPYKGESAALTDLIGGQIQMVAPNLGGAIQHIKEGKIRALAVTSKERAAQVADVPALGVDPRLRRRGLVRAGGACRHALEVIDRIHRDSAKILMADEFKARLAQIGIPGGEHPGGIRRRDQEESNRWSKVIKDRGLAQN